MPWLWRRASSQRSAALRITDEHRLSHLELTSGLTVSRVIRLLIWCSSFYKEGNWGWEVAHGLCHVTQMISRWEGAQILIWVVTVRADTAPSLSHRWMWLMQSQLTRCRGQQFLPASLLPAPLLPSGVLTCHAPKSPCFQRLWILDVSPSTVPNCFNSLTTWGSKTWFSCWNSWP